MLGTALATSAQDKAVELKFAHWVPAQHALAVAGFVPWAKSVEAASGGSIKVSIFPAQQLGKAADHYDLARDGIAQMTYVNPGYQAGRFPIFDAANLPFLVDKPAPASAALDSWYRAYAEREMKDVKVCFAHLHVGTLHSKVAITDPAQIKGMKIRPASGAVGQMMSLLGATNVQVSAPEARDALSKGVADAITFPLELDHLLRHRQGSDLPHRHAAVRGGLCLGHEQAVLRGLRAPGKSRSSTATATTNGPRAWAATGARPKTMAAPSWRPWPATPSCR